MTTSQKPDRAALLVSATRRVIERAGIKGVTYRVVAKEANVALGSATYYFPTLEDLLSAAIRSSFEDDTLAARAWFKKARGDDPAAAIMQWFTAALSDRAALTAEYELYFAAMSMPELRHIAAEWHQAFADAIDLVVHDRERSFVVAAFLDACYMQAVLGAFTTPESLSPVEAGVRRLLRPN
ncbi:TetR family transcriptional regulator [Streptomyces sp. NPDC006356]